MSHIAAAFRGRVIIGAAEKIALVEAAAFHAPCLLLTFHGQQKLELLLDKARSMLEERGRWCLKARVAHHDQNLTEKVGDQAGQRCTKPRAKTQKCSYRWEMARPVAKISWLGSVPKKGAK